MEGNSLELITSYSNDDRKRKVAIDKVFMSKQGIDPNDASKYAMELFGLGGKKDD